jgi:hypothetical protein
MGARYRRRWPAGGAGFVVGLVAGGLGRPWRRLEPVEDLACPGGSTPRRVTRAAPDGRAARLGMDYLDDRAPA